MSTITSYAPWVGAGIALTAGYLFFKKPLDNKPLPDVQLSQSAPLENGAHFDVIIVGAGISGISAARELHKKCPNKSFVILENRSEVGGTWDLFRYPGIRSDSDMYTLGFSYKPWPQSCPIAQGSDIRKYIKIVSKENEVDSRISYQKRVVEANFSSENSQWNLTVEVTNETGEKSLIGVSCGVLHWCTGYYDYQHAYQPHFEAQETFKGSIIHPQFWDENFDYRDKRVVIIGSGATAVTLLPSMTTSAQHVCMLQRSPTYIMPMPQNNSLTNLIFRLLPQSLAYKLARLQHILLGVVVWAFCKGFPNAATKFFIGEMAKVLPKGYDVDKHFRPHYKPWEQRLCLAPDGDFFKAIRAGKASVVTDQIDRFVEDGILLKSGEVLNADVIITATGLAVQLFGGARILVDGQCVDISQKYVYRGMMYENVPNLLHSIGYTNASWTLKCELTSCWLARVINHMDKIGAKSFVPYLAENHDMTPAPLLNLNSGYLQRALHIMPKVGNRAPWTYNNYPGDIFLYLFGRVEDGVLKFQSTSSFKSKL